MSLSNNKDSKRTDTASFGLMEGIVLSIGLILCVYVAFRKMDSDLFFLINNGKYIYTTGDFFPSHLFSTIHKDFSTVIQQPLWSLALYILFRFMGIASIPVFICLFVIADTLLLFAIYKNVSWPFARVSLVSFSLIIICVSFSGRPCTFSIFNLILAIYVLERIKDNSADARLALLLFPFSILELLCHASFYPILIFVELYYLLSFDLISNLKRFRYLIISVTLSIISSFLTPYRDKLPLYSLYSYGSATYGNLISELKPTELISIYTLLMIIVGALALWRLWKWHADGVLLTAAGIVSLIMHTRNIYLFGVLIIPLLKSTFSGRVFFEGADTFSQGSRIHIRFFIPILLALLYAIEVLYLYKSYAIKDTHLSPILACNYLFDNASSSDMIYSDLNQGAFLEFNGFDTYIDARPELYFKKINGKEDTYIEYVSLSLDEGFDYNSFIEKYGFTYLLTGTQTKFYEYLTDGDRAECILTGNGYALFKVMR